MADRTEIQVGENGRRVKIVRRTAASLRTATGSIYRVIQDGQGRWWFSADNVANPNSRALDPRLWWPIQRPAPWPPDLGRGIELRAPSDLERGDPDRPPGGGKITSPVRLVQPERL